MFSVQEAMCPITGCFVRIVDETAIARRQGEIKADPPSSAGVLVWCNQEGGKKTFVRARVQITTPHDSKFKISEQHQKF